MSLDLEELERLAAGISNWSLEHSWIDHSEDEPAAVVGSIDDEGNAYPVVVVDCDRYGRGDYSKKVADFYAAANPDAVLDLVRRLKAAERERDELKAQLAELEKQEPVGEVYESEVEVSLASSLVVKNADINDDLPAGTKLYARPVPPQQGHVTVTTDAPATTEPAPPKRPKLKVGQIWKDRMGNEVELTENTHRNSSRTFPFQDHKLGRRTYTEDGYFVSNYGPCEFDLVELVRDVEAPK